MADVDSSGMECLKSKVDDVGKRGRADSWRREDDVLADLLRWEGRKSLVNALAMLCAPAAKTGWKLSMQDEQGYEQEHGRRVGGSEVIECEPAGFGRRKPAASRSKMVQGQTRAERTACSLGLAVYMRLERQGCPLKPCGGEGWW